VYRRRYLLIELIEVFPAGFLRDVVEGVPEGSDLDALFQVPLDRYDQFHGGSLVEAFAHLGQLVSNFAEVHRELLLV